MSDVEKAVKLVVEVLPVMNKEYDDTVKLMALKTLITLYESKQQKDYMESILMRAEQTQEGNSFLS